MPTGRLLIVNLLSILKTFSIFGIGFEVVKVSQQSETPDGQASSSKAGTSVSGSSKATSDAHSDIKADQLEARLNNHHQTEIRDTIQAILASLQDAATYEQATVSKTTTSSSSSSSSDVGSSSKGKEKAAEPQAKSESETTSMDVLKSMDTVHSIEAAFSALQQDFTFPSQLDFTPPAYRPSSPTSDTLTSKLAYTVWKHPFSYYEQSLIGITGAILVGGKSFWFR
ncbi:hypothetical protein MPER_00591 [Moniliophthora perniciosa FA553]|nr:hypothetical protein MPER_00591 [Moniliophthora perniciosa FA553]